MSRHCENSVFSINKLPEDLLRVHDASERRRADSQARWLLLLASGLALGAWFIWIALNRIVASDEGFYLYAAELVGRGKFPYLDFFYPQSPYLPYWFAPATGFSGLSWVAARVLAALFTTLTGLLLLFHSFRTRSSFVFSLSILSLYSLTHLVYGWFPLAKSYGLSSFLMVLGYTLAKEIQKARFHHQKFLPFLCGLVLAMVVGVRSLYAPAVVLLVSWLAWRALTWRGESRSVMLFGALGAVIGSLPVLILFIIQSDAFWLNNFGYHSLQFPVGGDIFPLHKWHRLGILLGFHSYGPYGLQFGLLFWGTTLLAGLRFCIDRYVSIAYLLALTLVAVHILPPPMHLQYFSTAVPFLFLGILELLPSYQVLQKVPWSMHKVLFVSLGLVYCLSGLFSVPAYVTTGKQLMYRSEDRNQKLEEISELTAFLRTQIEPGEPVFALWPGHLVGTGAVAVSGMENNFTARIGSQFSEAERRRFHLITPEEQLAVLKNGETRHAVFLRTRLPRKFQEALSQGGYQLVREFENSLVFRVSNF